ncbi:hypothetical protein [Deinococcus sp.]|uniref:hypothetical protein n=1 Tax=Deinococcus sp. TaxID=47478 RepID=UPI003B5A2F73
MASISQIVWPKNENDAEKLYVSFALDIVKLLSIRLDFACDPLEISRHFLDGLEWQTGYDECSKNLRSIIDSYDDSRNFDAEKILSARLALLVMPTPNKLNRCEKIDWMFQIIESLGKILALQLS